MPPPMATGCACDVGASHATPSGLGVILAALCGLGLLWRRRRMSLRSVYAMLPLVLIAAGCGGNTMTMDPMMMDMGMTPKQQLAAALGTSTWNGQQTRAGKMRAIELRFNAASLLWADVRNPFGPARRRELRVFTIDEDGSTLRSTITQTPDGSDAARPIGKQETWKVTISAGSPRTLQLVNQDTPGVTETYTEGAWPTPMDGLTATVRVFPASGPTNDAYCGKSQATLIKPDHATLFEFARGRSTETVLGIDRMAGAKLNRWVDNSGANRFAVTDVPSFSDLGGTTLSDQANFFVHYQGTVNHPGGVFQMREQDDDVSDGLWVFIEGKVGSTTPGDLFLEVHNLTLVPDETTDEPMKTIPAGPVPIEIMAVRCAKTVRAMDIQIRLNGGAYQAVGAAPTSSLINDTLFPPAL